MAKIFDTPFNPGPVPQPWEDPVWDADPTETLRELGVVTAPWDSAPNAPQSPLGVPAQGVPASRGTGSVGVPAQQTPIPPGAYVEDPNGPHTVHLNGRDVRVRPRDSDKPASGSVKVGRKPKYPDLAELYLPHNPKKYRNEALKRDRKQTKEYGQPVEMISIPVPEDRRHKVRHVEDDMPEIVQSTYHTWEAHHEALQSRIAAVTAELAGLMEEDDRLLLEHLNARKEYLND